MVRPIKKRNYLVLLVGLKSCCCIYSTGMVERLQNDTRMMEDLGSIQIGKNILNVPYIYDDSDMLQ